MSQSSNHRMCFCDLFNDRFVRDPAIANIEMLRGARTAVMRKPHRGGVPLGEGPDWAVIAVQCVQKTG